MLLRTETNPLREMSKAKKAAFFGIFGALALVLSLAESLILPAAPFLPPGAKLGLSNIITLLCACFFGVPGALYTAVIKAVFALITRGGTAFLMSLCGGVLSAAAMAMMIKIPHREPGFLGIGVIGACCHNVGQLMVCLILTGTGAMVRYAPFLLLFGIVTGSITGLTVGIILPRVINTLTHLFIRRNTYEKNS